MSRLFKGSTPIHILFGMLLAFAITACDPTKRVAEGKHLLMNNRVVLSEGAPGTDRFEIEEIIKQQPNRKILWMRIYLGLHNGPDPEKVARKHEDRMRKLEEKNAERIAKGKEPKEYRRTRKEWYREVVGEPPVILDTALTRRSREQIKTYFLKEGYFDAVVSDSTRMKKKKGWVTYHIDPGEAHRINEVVYSVRHDLIDRYLAEKEKPLLEEKGERFDVDKLEQERERIEDHLQNLGYMYFNKAYVNYRVDTTVGRYKADVELLVAEPNSDSLRPGPASTVYNIDDVFIDLRRRGSRAGSSPTDTTLRDGYKFLHTGKPVIKPKALLNAVFIKPESRYKQREVDNTYRRLTGLRLFDRVEVRFDTTDQERPALADGRIRLRAAPQQGFSVEPYLTNRGGFLGTAISLNYDHKNVFRGMEALNIRMRLGLEAQQPITNTNNQGEANTNVGDDVLFNTVEVGPEVTLRLPSFLLPISRDKFARSAAPRTTLTTQYNYQRRPDFTRTLAIFSFGYEWNESPTKTWGVFPVNMNVIKIFELSDAFQDYLDRTNDPVLTNSYTDHLITGARIYYRLNTQIRSTQRHVFYYRPVLETSGNLLRGIFNWTNEPLNVDTVGEDFYTLSNVRFAQFVKLDNDFRYYHRPHDRSTVAFRVAAGVGVPLKNLHVLPFETSFFVGGANGLRAWRARSLGPGSYSEPLTTFDRIGEMRLEGNIEYRFDLVSFLEGALFMDAGNIWMLEEDERRPGSGISGDFYRDIAIGTGIGARLDFDFFIIRFDLGLQTKDPALPPGERWIWEPKNEYERQVSDFTGTDFQYTPVVNFNLGIGYPF